ncbi:MAG: acyl-CoA dehydratase activase [Planctomycetota bacterium]
MTSYFAGIDVGASAVKVVVINNRKEITARAARKTGLDIVSSVQSALDEARQSLNIARIFSTGFGRSNLPFAQGSITEISAHSKGVYHYFPRALTIIDIGAQDNKVIHLDNSGHLVKFKMNRKCAAGTGAFLEEIAYKMDIPLAELNVLAKRSANPVELGSYCTVFTATEILSRIREGKKKEDIVRGVYSSVVKRIIEMDPLQGEVVITGGVVAYNDVIVELLKGYAHKDVLVPPIAQFTGALGAALAACNNRRQ